MLIGRTPGFISCPGVGYCYVVDQKYDIIFSPDKAIYIAVLMIDGFMQLCCIFSHSSMTKCLRMKRFIRPPRPLHMLLLIMLALLLGGYSGSGKGSRGSGNIFSGSDLWEPLNRSNRSVRDAAGRAAIERKAESILDVFRQALPFNPPKGFAVMPRMEYLKPLSFPGNAHTPEPVHLRVAVRMPPASADIVAGVNVWINDPANLLGESLLSDSQGAMFLLPPEVGRMGGQKIVSRMAHPPGYDNEYPCTSIFPLWSPDQEPFLRSVVRPSFGLAKATVTTYFTAGDRPFWEPVSQERWIHAMIAQAEKTVGDIRAGVDAADELNITQQQIDQMKAYLSQLRESANEENIRKRYIDVRERLMPLYEMMKQNNPAEAEAFYQQSIVGLEQAMDAELSQAGERQKEVEEMEQKLVSALMQREEVWQQMKAAVETGNWDRIDELSDENNLDHLKLIADAGRMAGRLRAELAGMSPAERRAPAYGFEIPEDHPVGPHRQVVAMVFHAERPSGLVPANAKGARAIVSIDPGFFDFSDADAPIRLMAVEYWGRNDLAYDNNRRNLLEDIWQYLDWQALQGMMR